MSRPRTQIDKTQFEKLCAIQCTKDEIAAFFDCSEITLERWCKREYKERFDVVFGQKRLTGRSSLRRSQFEMARKNPTMAIWLGKQYLGQTDKQEVAVTKSIDATVKEMDDYFDHKKRDSRPTLGEPG